MTLRVNPQARILVTRADRIGDFVLSTPVLKALREKFPQAWISCLTFLENKDLIAGNPYINEFILYDKKGSEKGLWGNLSFIHKLSQRRFDLVVHLHATNRMHWLTRLAKIPVRIGWTRKAGHLLTHGFEDRKRKGEKHEAEYNFDLLEPLGISCPKEIETYFPIQDKARLSLAKLLEHYEIPQNKPWIVLSPGASCPSKRWPVERFGYLIDQISAEIDASFLVIGGSDDHERFLKIEQSAKTKVYNLTGRLSLGMLGALLEKSRVMISNDSGPVHIADAVKVPVVSIFGRKQPGLSPTRWRPLSSRSRVVWKDVGCDPCLAHDCQINFLCLDAISETDVMKEVRALFQSSFAGVQ